MSWIFFLIVIAGVAFYFTTPAERTRFFQALRAALLGARGAAVQRHAENAPYYDILRERTALALVTIALVVLNVATFGRMVFGDGSLSDPATLVAWGGNVGPRTTNGEWWRLIAAMFVHSGPLQLLINLVGLFQLGLLLERLVGHLVFAVVYLAAGVFASLVALTVSPVAVNVGAAGAIFGLYGLLLASIVWSALHRTPATMPWRVLKGLLPTAGVFLLYNLITSNSGGWVELVGLVTGLSSGLVVARGVSDAKPPARRMAIVTSAAMALALAFTVPLRGITDARPEVRRIIAAEERTAGEYEKAVLRFNDGLIPTAALTRLIDRQIVPDIQTARARLKALTGVPREHQPMVAATEEYLRLREESWRLRSRALQTTSMITLKKADRTEWDSMEAFKRIKQTGA